MGVGGGMGVGDFLFNKNLEDESSCILASKLSKSARLKSLFS